MRRKYGYSEIDDPSVHRGLEQHAFVVGDYGAALCGAKAYGWRKPRHIRLALPTEENPSCRKCSMAIAFEVSETVSVDRLMEMTTPADRKEIEKAVKVARKAFRAGEPVSIETKRHAACRGQSRGTHAQLARQGLLSSRITLPDRDAAVGGRPRSAISGAKLHT